MIFKSECKVTKKKRTVQIFRMIFLSKKPFLLFLPPSEKHKSTPFEGFAIPNESRTNREHFLLATKYSKATRWRTRKNISA